MKIALLGYGKMGKLVELEAEKRGDLVVAKAGRNIELLDNLHDADVCIDFSGAERVSEHVAIAGKAGKNIVIGTTGWERSFDQILQLIREYRIGALYAANFSIGVHLFKKIIEEAATLMKHFSDYDVAGCETHHKNKADTPSGTAKLLAESIVNKMKRHTPLTFSSVRCGEVPGIHTVIFDSLTDTITLTHEARSREGFARGALDAAMWLQGKKGYYTIDDMLIPNGIQ